MTYKLRVIYPQTHPEAGCSSQIAWNNFCDYIRCVPRWQPNMLNCELKEFNAVNEHGENYIVFETEEDATAFVLRFS